MKKAIKFIIALFLGGAIFVLVLQKAGLDTLSRAFYLFFSLEGLLIVFLTLFIILVGVWRWKMILSCQGVDKKVSELVGIWTIGGSIDYLTPVSLFGGEAIRVYLTGRTLDIEWEKSFSSVIIDKILDGTFHILFIILGLAVFLNFGDFPYVWLFWLVVISIGALSLVLIFFYSRAIGKKSIILFILKFFGLEKTQVKSTKNGEFIFNTEGNVLRFFSPKKLFFWKGIFFSFFRHSLIYLRAFVIIYFLVEVIEPVRVLAGQGLAYLSLLLPLPAGLGGLEAISAYGFDILGFGFETGTVFGMTWRAADLLMVLLALVFGVKIGLTLFKLQIFDFIDRVKSGLIK